MKLKFTLLLFFLCYSYRSSAENCINGCLKCEEVVSQVTPQSKTVGFLSNEERVLQGTSSDPQFKCLVSDLSMKYYLVKDKPVKSSLNNCDISSSNGELCVMCEKNFIYNADFQKCMEIPSSKKIINCANYDKDLNCVRCLPATFFDVQNKICVPVITKITGCLLYKDLKNCAFCEQGYFLQTTQGANPFLTCVSNATPTKEGEQADTGVTPPSDPACKYKSSFECLKCKSTFFLDYNYMHKLNYQTENNFANLLASDFHRNFGIFNSDLLKEIISPELLSALGNTLSSLGTFNPCIPGIVKNCKEFIAFDKCKTCDTNFYLASESSCIAQPVPPITNCLIYISDSKCQKCNNGYYLGNQGSDCVEVTQVTNCNKYQGVSNKCAECNAITLYVNEIENLCKDRQNSPIQDCLKFNLIKDECSACMIDNLLSANKLKCMKIPDNCEVYKEENLAVKCSSCKPEHYLSSDLCKKGTIGNCELYDQTKQNICLKCKFQFYKNSVETCTNFSKALDKDCIGTGNVDNQCIKCDGAKFSVVRQKRCVQMQSSDTSLGCAAFDANSKCIECKNGFFGLNCQFENSDTSVGCSKFENNSDDLAVSNCLVCERDSHYLDGQACKVRHNLSLKNCMISQTGKNECQLCNTDSAPRNAYKLTSCVSTSNLQLTPDILSNCEIYDIDTSKCQVCKTDFKMDGSNGCVPACPSPKIVVEGIYEQIDKEQLYLGNQCVEKPYYLGDCEEVGVQPPKNLFCKKCKAGYKFSYDVFSGNGYTGSMLIHNYNILTKSFMGSATYASFGCAKEDTDIGKDSSNAALFNKTDCEVFSVNNGFLYCSKCVNGKVGIVVKDTYGNKSLSLCSTKDEFENSTFYNSISYAMSTRASPPLEQSLQTLFSVHKCTDATKIVYLIAKLVVTNSSSKFVLDVSNTNNTPATSTESMSSSFNQFCDTKTKLDNSDLDNCLLGVLDIENNTARRYFCVACVPGFRATKFELNGIYIKKCEAIENCGIAANDLQANSCATCTSGSWRYSINSAQVMFDFCGQNAIENCLLVDSLVQTMCAVCKKGYFLSIDKTKCMDQTEENCAVKGSDFLFNIDTSKQNGWIIILRHSYEANQIVYKISISYRKLG